MNKKPQIRDAVKADYAEDGHYEYGKIMCVDFEKGLCFADIGDMHDFCGDIPTQKDADGVWIFEGF